MKSIETLKDKKVIVFSVGASQAKPKALEDIMAKDFSLEMARFVAFYHLRGRFWLQEAEAQRQDPDVNVEDETEG